MSFGDFSGGSTWIKEVGVPCLSDHVRQQTLSDDAKKDYACRYGETNSSQAQDPDALRALVLVR